MEILYKSTRGGETGVTASQAILKGLAQDGGLFVPDRIPALDVPMETIARMSYQEVAYEVMSHQLKTGAFNGTALLCTTQAVAIGAIRAFHEYGIQVGKDVSVCAINDDGISRYLCPSLTCFQLPENLIGYLRLCVEWMLRDKQKWDGPLKFQADGDNLFIGESTNILQTAIDKTKP